MERISTLDAREQRVHHIHGRQRARLERVRQLGDAGPDGINSFHETGL
jgi:hypothetical protein